MDTISRDDPRLTAYALGELSPEEIPAIEEAVRRDPQLQQEVEDIRATADALRDALKSEPLPQTAKPAQSSVKAKSRRPVDFHKVMLYGLSGCAAVCLAAVSLITLFGGTTEDTLKTIGEEITCASATQLETDGGAQQAHDKDNFKVSQEKRHLVEGRYFSEKEEEKFGVGVSTQTPVPGNVTLSQRNFDYSESKEQAAMNSMKQEMESMRGPMAEERAKMAANAGGAPEALKSANGKATVKISGGANVEYNTNNFSSKPQASVLSSPSVLVANGRNSSVSAPTKNKMEVYDFRDIAAAAPDAKIMPEDGESAVPDVRQQSAASNTEAYDKIVENEFLRSAEQPLSTFSIDVDTASYSNLRRMLTGGQLPPAGAVRIEELVNYFDYDYQPPQDGKPFATRMALATCPWNPQHQLLRVGLKGKILAAAERPDCNLVFLLDVSGSMNAPNKLPLVREGMKLLVHQLKDNDRVAIAVYAGASGLVLPATPCSDRQKILAAIDSLTPGGSTNGAAGIQLAYATAASGFLKNGVNRVILCTDGDFNVGVTNQSELTDLIEKKAKEGVFLTVLGFGMGNYKDSTLQKLADKGNGNYGYIDTLAEAKKLLVEQMTGTLMTIAKDVKIQIEFNPQLVQAYRLIGYEKRKLNKEDFNDDQKDAGEIGAGHTVTALYELIPAGVEMKSATPKVDPLKYQAAAPADASAAAAKEVVTKPESAQELLTLKLRYKEPDGEVSKLLEFPLKNATAEWDSADGDLRFAASVAAWGMLLRGSQFAGDATYAKVIAWAEAAKGSDPTGYRAEFLKLVRATASLSNR